MTKKKTIRQRIEERITKMEQASIDKDYPRVVKLSKQILKLWQQKDDE